LKERIVCVEWDDASSNSGYYDRKSPERFEPVRCHTVGHFIKRTKKAVIVSQERFYDDKGKIEDDRRIVTIPKKMIIKVIEMRARENT